MALSTAIYGSRIEADEYFQNKLHETAWSLATTADQDKALLLAARAIDSLAFKGNKTSVYNLFQSVDYPTAAQIRAAEESQELEFPRDGDTDVPLDIRIAQYEEAYARLDGKDPDLEMEALAISSQQVESARTTFDRSNVPIEHLSNGIASLSAWRRLRPYLRDGRAIRLLRA